jgi:GTP diphosphokinase / guanosine-3',5'-bis(diphosphate) 3'-diphosphatase
VNKFNILSRAYELAKKAHKGQKRHSDEDYFMHCDRVATSVAILGWEYQVVGYLHDVLEDTDYSSTDISEILFGADKSQVIEAFGVDSIHRILAGINALNKNNYVNYPAYILALRSTEWGKNKLVITNIPLKVKIADLLDNMRDLKEGSLKDKYRLACFILENSDPPISKAP